jgi:hypothetical protein
VIYVVGWVILRISYSIAVRMLNFKVYIIQSYGPISLSDPECTIQCVEIPQKVDRITGTIGEEEK